MLHCYYFSASNTTERIVRFLSDMIDSSSDLHNLTRREASFDKHTFAPDDIVLFAAPVYGGRIPAVAAEKFRQVKGKGQKCIVIAVYGNRDYDDALVELCDIAAENGFEMLAAAAFVAQHSIVPSVAASRPDEDDLVKLENFAGEIRDAIEKGETLDMSAVKGNRPYKAYGVVPLHPRVDDKKCDRCGICAQECPAGAIDFDNPDETDKEICISCSRCITVCPEKARSFGGIKYKAFAPVFKAKCSARLEPEWHVGQ